MSVALSMTEESNRQGIAPESHFAHVTLRQAREAAGLQLAALAATLKVPAERLLALEEGRYQDLPNLTFARALASSVCRALKIDPAPVLQGLPQVHSVKLGNDHPAQPMVDLPRRRGWSGLSSLGLRSPFFWAALLLLLAVALWWWLPQRESVAEPEPQAEPQGQSVVVEPVPTQATPALSAQPLLAPTQPASVVEPPAAAAQSAIVPAPAAAPVAPLVPAAVQPAAPVQPLVLLRASATTWVQIKDSAGKVLQQKNLQPGQTLEHDGRGPVQIVLGRVGGVEVTVRGQPFDTSSFAANRVARFEVK